MMMRQFAVFLAVCLLGLLSSSESSAQDGNCPAAPTQLAVGMTARTNDPLKVRSGPGTNNSEVGKVTLDRTVRIIGGPACDGGWRWWQIQATDNSASGWSVEVGSGNVYLLLPDGTALGAHNRWDPANPDGYQHPPSVADVVPTTPAPETDCQNVPFVGMKFYSTYDSMIGPRVFESVAVAANWYGFTGEPMTEGYVGVIEYVGIDRLYEEQPIDFSRAYRYQVLAGPQMYMEHQFWKVSLPNSPFEGWVRWGTGFCEFDEGVYESLPGWTTPQASYYAFVPPVIHPDLLAVRELSDENSPLVGSIEVTHYYSILNTLDKWTLLGGPNGEVGWVDSRALQVGTLTSDVEEWQNLLVNGQAIVNYYDDAHLPVRYNEAREDLLDQWGQETADIISRTYAVYEIVSPRTGGLTRVRKAVCLVLDINTEQSSIEHTLELGCAGYEFVDSATDVITGNMLAVYLKISEMSFENLGPFVRWNDEMWMDNLNMTFSSCPLLRLFYGQTCQW